MPCWYRKLYVFQSWLGVLIVQGSFLFVPESTKAILACLDHYILIVIIQEKNLIAVSSFSVHKQAVVRGGWLLGVILCTNSLVLRKLACLRRWSWSLRLKEVTIVNILNLWSSCAFLLPAILQIQQLVWILCFSVLSVHLLDTLFVYGNTPETVRCLFETWYIL